MRRDLRKVLFPVALAALLAVAGFGIRQVVVGQEGPPPPPLPEELPTIQAGVEGRSRAAVEEFMANGGDPCSLPAYEIEALSDSSAYGDLPALVNDAETIVIAEITEVIMQPPPESSGTSRLLVTVHVDQTLKGQAPASVMAASGHVVRVDGTELARLHAGSFDPCTMPKLLLFLEQPWADASMLSFMGYQGWAEVNGETITPAGGNTVFQGYESEQALAEAIGAIASEQAAAGLPEGRLLCESKRTSDVYLDPFVCPGDTANLAETFGLASATGATIGAGPSEIAVADSQLSALVSALDTPVALGPDGPSPDDLVVVEILLPTNPEDRTALWLEYSPSAGALFLPASNAQFPAPAAFVAAIQPFVVDAS